MKTPRKAGDRCVACGRLLKNQGRVIPGIGALGPSCFAKFAAYERVLEEYDAGPLYYTGGLVVRRDEGPERVKQIEALVERLRQGGIRVAIERPEEDLLTIRVVGFVEAPKARKRALNVWEQWKKDLERRTMERDFGFGEVE